MKAAYFPSIILIAVFKFNKLNDSDSSFIDIIRIETDNRAIVKIDGFGQLAFRIFFNPYG